MAVVNSEQFAWRDIKIVMMGRIVTGVRSIKYKTSQEKEPLYGAGDKPLSIQRGNRKYEGSIKLLQSEYQGLINAAAPTSDIMDIPPFDITVCYIAQGASLAVTRVLKLCQFTESEEGMSQGDKHAEIELPFVALDIENS
ncbi:MAG: hypothetical protein K2Q03_03515 [Sphingobacteriaceae bacterium]|nr:hypothetical protein [Sphingobacteriaceae bacterium]